MEHIWNDESRLYECPNSCNSLMKVKRDQKVKQTRRYWAHNLQSIKHILKRKWPSGTKVDIHNFHSCPNVWPKIGCLILIWVFLIFMGTNIENVKSIPRNMLFEFALEKWQHSIFCKFFIQSIIGGQICNFVFMQFLWHVFIEFGKSKVVLDLSTCASVTIFLSYSRKQWVFFIFKETQFVQLRCNYPMY